jgi:carbamoylphosphate synthase large subunit
LEIDQLPFQAEIVRSTERNKLVDLLLVLSAYQGVLLQVSESKIKPVLAVVNVYSVGASVHLVPIVKMEGI